MRINTPSYSPLFLPANHQSSLVLHRFGSSLSIPLHISRASQASPPPWRIQTLPLLGCPPFGPHFVPRVPSDVS